MTFRQALELGAAVRKGETGTTVVFASSFLRAETSEAGEAVEHDIPFLKAYTVFEGQFGVVGVRTGPFVIKRSSVQGWKAGAVEAAGGKCEYLAAIGSDADRMFVLR